LIPRISWIYFRSISFFQITVKKLFDLLWSESFVQLGHSLKPPLQFWTISLKSKRTERELSTECYESFEILPFGPPRSTQEGWAKISPLSTPLWITQKTQNQGCTFKL
jgi:hypothetical protein